MEISKTNRWSKKEMSFKGNSNKNEEYEYLSMHYGSIPCNLTERTGAFTSKEGLCAEGLCGRPCPKGFTSMTPGGQTPHKLWDCYCCNVVKHQITKCSCSSLFMGSLVPTSVVDPFILSVLFSQFCGKLLHKPCLVISHQRSVSNPEFCYQ